MERIKSQSSFSFGMVDASICANVKHVTHENSLTVLENAVVSLNGSIKKRPTLKEAVRTPILVEENVHSEYLGLKVKTFIFRYKSVTYFFVYNKKYFFLVQEKEKNYEMSSFRKRGDNSNFMLPIDWSKVIDLDNWQDVFSTTMDGKGKLSDQNIEFFRNEENKSENTKPSLKSGNYKAGNQEIINVFLKNTVINELKVYFIGHCLIVVHPKLNAVILEFPDGKSKKDELDKKSIGLKASFITEWNDRLWLFDVNTEKEHDVGTVHASSIGFDLQGGWESLKKQIEQEIKPSSRNDPFAGFNIILNKIKFTKTVKWVVAERTLYFGTEHGIYSMRTMTRNTIMNQKNIKVVLEHHAGSCNIEPIVLEDCLIYVSEQRDELHSISLESTDMTRNTKMNITLWCNSFFKGSTKIKVAASADSYSLYEEIQVPNTIKNIVLDKNQIIWILTHSNKVFSLTVSPNAEILAFSQHVLEYDLWIHDLALNYKKEVYFTCHRMRGIGNIKCDKFSIFSLTNNNFKGFITIQTHNYMREKDDYFSKWSAKVQEVTFLSNSNKITEVICNDVSFKIIPSLITNYGNCYKYKITTIFPPRDVVIICLKIACKNIVDDLEIYNINCNYIAEPC